MAVTNLVGQTLGQYQLQGLIGTGGMGAVYRGYQANLRRVVAVKVMSASLIERPEYAERFNREAQIVAGLEHAHIVPIYDYGTQEKITYVVMRYLTGGSLADRMSHRPAGPSLGEAAEILRQLASALDYAHARSVIHRDIKANNVMFDDEGSAYLVDFGIAKLLDATTSLTSPSVTIGTPLYMSPEQWRGEKITPAADQYSLGVLIYTILTNGRPPFEAETPYALMHKHLNEPPTPIEVHRNDLPRSIRLVIERAIAKAPESRYANAREFASAFSEAVRSIPSVPTGFFKTPLPSRGDRPTGQSSTPLNTTAGTSPVLIPPPGFTPAGSRTPTGGSPNLPSTPAGGSPRTPQTPVYGTPPPSSPTLTPTSGAGRGGLRLPIVAIAALLVLIVGGVALALFGNDIFGGVPTNSTAVPSEIPAIVAVETETVMPSHTSTFTPEPTETATPLPSETSTSTATETPSATLTLTPTDTATPSDTPTPTATDTPTPSDTPTHTATPTETPSNTPTETLTLTPTNTATPTPATAVAFGVRPLIARVGPESRFPVLATIPAGDELDIIGISEDGQWIQVVFKDGSIGWIAFAAASLETGGDLRLVPVAVPPTETPTFTLTPSETPTPTATDTYTSTPTDTATFIPTETPSPTEKPSLTPTETLTLTPTDTSTFTPAPTDTSIPTDTPTNTPMPTDTPTFTPIPTDTPTLTATPTLTFTVTPSWTPTPSRTRTPTPTATPLLEIGDAAQVVVRNDDELAMRRRPSVSAGLMDLLPNGSLVEIIGGPVESEGFIWWQIRAESTLTGWAVDEADGIRTLVRMGDDNVVTTMPLVCAGGTLRTRLQIGDLGRVADEDPRPLNVRVGAGTNYERAGQLLINDIFEVLDGPVCSGGLAWFRIRFNTTREGWIAEGDTVYFVEPIG